MFKIVLVRDVEIYGKLYTEGMDVSGVDPGVVQSLLSVGWAKQVQTKPPSQVESQKVSKKKSS